jgi:hypothetical protein
MPYEPEIAHITDFIYHKPDGSTVSGKIDVTAQVLEFKESGMAVRVADSELDVGSFEKISWAFPPKRVQLLMANREIPCVKVSHPTLAEDIPDTDLITYMSTMSTSSKGALIIDVDTDRVVGLHNKTDPKKHLGSGVLFNSLLRELEKLPSREHSYFVEHYGRLFEPPPPSEIKLAAPGPTITVPA